jgi:hypothetical protein
MKPIVSLPVPPPVPPQSSVADDERRGWFVVVDEFVDTIYRNGFVQSLIVHVAVLLLLAMIVVVPERLRQPVAIALAFTPPGEEIPDTVEFELPAPGPEDLVAAEPDAAAPEPLPDVAAAEMVVEPDELDLAAFVEVEPLPIADAAALAADVPSARPLRLADRVARGGAAGDGMDGTGGGGIGGEIGRRLKAAGAGTGDVQISIAWSNVNDIDLHVLFEGEDQRGGGSLINFMNRVGIGGGWLDVDRNVHPTTVTPVENVFWGRGRAPFGRYTVAVHHFRDWGGRNPTLVELVVLVDGREQRFHTEVRPGDPAKIVTSFVRRRDGDDVSAADASPSPRR